AREQQTYTQQMGMIAQAAALQANPFRQQQALGHTSGLLGGQGVAGFQAPDVVPGVGPAGGTMQGGMGYLQQMIGDITGGQRPATGPMTAAWMTQPGQPQAGNAQWGVMSRGATGDINAQGNL